MKVDYTLYLVTDRKLMSTQTLTEAVKQAILGGCTTSGKRQLFSGIFPTGTGSKTDYGSVSGASDYK